MHNLILECVHACMWKEVSVSKRSACPKACLLPNSAPCVELYVQNLVLLVSIVPGLSISQHPSGDIIIKRMDFLVFCTVLSLVCREQSGNQAIACTFLLPIYLVSSLKREKKCHVR
jgi:hypothetical protein